METKHSLPCLQEHDTDLCLEPGESGPYHQRHSRPNLICLSVHRCFELCLLFSYFWCIV